MKYLAIVLLLLVGSAAPAQPGAPLLPALPKPTPPRALPAAKRDAMRPLPFGEPIPDWRARWELAQALSYLRRYDESLAEFRKVLAERPGDVAVRQDYGQVLLWAGRADEAYAELNAVPLEQLKPEGVLALADTLVARRDYERAEKIFAAQLQRVPDDQLTRLKLAEILSWTKRYDASLALYREILAARPDDIQVRRRYALVLLWAGRTDESAAELRRTLSE